MANIREFMRKNRHKLKADLMNTFTSDIEYTTDTEEASSSLHFNKEMDMPLNVFQGASKAGERTQDLSKEGYDNPFVKLRAGNNDMFISESSYSSVLDSMKSALPTHRDMGDFIDILQQHNGIFYDLPMNLTQEEKEALATMTDTKRHQYRYVDVEESKRADGTEYAEEQDDMVLIAKELNKRKLYESSIAKLKTIKASSGNTIYNSIIKQKPKEFKVKSGKYSIKSSDIFFNDIRVISRKAYVSTSKVNVEITFFVLGEGVTLEDRYDNRKILTAGTQKIMVTLKNYGYYGYDLSKKENIRASICKVLKDNIVIPNKLREMSKAGAIGEYNKKYGVKMPKIKFSSLFGKIIFSLGADVKHKGMTGFPILKGNNKFINAKRINDIKESMYNSVLRLYSGKMNEGNANAVIMLNNKNFSASNLNVNALISKCISKEEFKTHNDSYAKKIKKDIYRELETLHSYVGKTATTVYDYRGKKKKYTKNVRIYTGEQYRKSEKNMDKMFFRGYMPSWKPSRYVFMSIMDSKEVQKGWTYNSFIDRIRKEALKKNNDKEFKIQLTNDIVKQFIFEDGNKISIAKIISKMIKEFNER